MSDSVTIATNVSRLTLESVGKGLPDQQFQSEVQRFLTMAREHRESLDLGQGGVYASSGNHLKAKITVTVDLDWNLESDSLSVNAGVTGSMPGRKTTSHAVIVRGEKAFVESDEEQTPLLNARRREQS